MTWKKVRRSSFRRIQRYQHNYCLLSLTGCLGCRWKRYQQSKKSYTPCDHVWSVLLLVTFSLSSVFLFHWLCAANEQANINYILFSWFHYWVNWYYVVKAVTIAVYSYLCFLVILSLLHMCLGYQLYIHHVHRIVLVILLVLVVTEVILFLQVPAQLWAPSHIALKVFGPYIQLIFVFILTILSWLVAGIVWRTDRTAFRVCILGAFVCVATIIYLSPLMNSYPCVCAKSQLPPKPRLLAHRGGAATAPENTMAAFESAVQYNASILELDVSITADGQLYAFHDTDLRRTTDVSTVLPDNTTAPFWELTSDEIDLLNAGQWFIRLDPFGTVSSLTHSTRQIYSGQTVPLFSDVIQLAKRNNVSLMFDVMPRNVNDNLPSDHPYKVKYRDLIMNEIDKSGIDKNKIYWLESFNSSLPAPAGTIPVTAGSDFTTDELREWDIQTLNSQSVSEEMLRLYRHHHIDVFVHVVDTEWMMSYYWCVGVAGVTTNYVSQFSLLTQPRYTWEPQSYLLVWILSDCVSAAVITVIFITQYFRHCGGRFVPDVSMSMRPRGQMKEKLLYVVDRASPDVGIEHSIQIRDMGCRGSAMPSVDSLDRVSMDPSISSIKTIESYNMNTANNNNTDNENDEITHDTSLSDVSIIMDKY